MIKHTEALIKTLHKPIVWLLFAFILLFGINFVVPEANASNLYTSDIKFYEKDNSYFIDFFVNTTFTHYDFMFPTMNSDRTLGFTQNCLSMDYIDPIPENCVLESREFYRHCQFIAGNTYKINLTGLNDNAFEGCYTKSFYISKYGVPNSTHYIQFSYFGYPLWEDLEEYHFSETPTLNITFPLQNAEISQAFNIIGSYTIPETSGITKLIAFFRPVDLPYATYSFHQNLTYFSGDVNIRASGIQADDYTIEFCFVGLGIEAICLDDQNIDISIVARIPPELPETQETPPEVYDPIDADQFYLDFSGYETPTAMYNNLKNAIQPIFTTIGSNLTFFTSRFDSETAKDTGEKTGQAILLVRSYSSNLNTFFNDLPVSEFLFFYLTLLIVVIVFRIIKNLINLIKP